MPVAFLSRRFVLLGERHFQGTNLMGQKRGGEVIRVAHVVLQLSTGGMEKLLVEFARYADREWFDLRFISLGGRGRLADDLEACGWPVTALDQPPGLRPRGVLRLARLFRQWQLDVVHVHNSKPLIYAAPAARLARVPRVVYTRHGQRFHARFRETLLFRLASRLPDRIVCVSHDSARLSGADGLPADRLTTIWNGIDVHRFAYAGPRRGGPVVTVCRLSPEKDVATLLYATALAARLDPDVRVEVAGDGPCLPDLKRLAGELGLGGRVTFLGEVRDVPGLLGRASAFVLPSLSEGISLTLLEAMARGLPVVASRVGGNPEVVRDGETGYLVPPQQPQLLADRMLQLRRDTQTATDLGRRGRERVVAHFRSSQMVAGYEALYHALLGTGRVSAPTTTSNPHSEKVLPCS
jgi:glycosyltransferase involved in cell wall biosynthesis